MARIVRLVTIMCLALGVAGLGACPAQRAFASGPQTISVATCDETHLDAAVSTANADNAGDTIDFQCSGTITLTSTLAISGNMTIDGSGESVVIDGGHTTSTTGVSIVSVGSGVSLGLSNLTLQHGYAAAIEGGAVHNDGSVTITNSTLSNNLAFGNNDHGAAIYSTGIVTIAGSTLSGNSADFSGGAITSSGMLTITDSVISDNASENGAALFNSGTATISGSTLSDNQNSQSGAITNSGTLTITTSTLSSNTGDGPALVNQGTATVTASTFSGNRGYDGGGIDNFRGTLSVTGSTFSGNTAEYGAGISNDIGTATVTTSTFSGNSADRGGGVQNRDTMTITNSTFAGNSDQFYEGAAIANMGTTRVGATILTKNSSDTCGFSSVSDLGYNLEDDAGASCGFSSAKNDIVGQDPKLGSLADNGGPTKTMALPADSPAVDYIPTTISTLCPASGTDQRGAGYPRPDAGEAACDIGAYEYQDPRAVTTTALSSSSNPSAVGQQVTYTATVNPAPDGGTVDFQDGGSDIDGCGSVAVSTSTGQAVCQVTYSASGSHTITAAYSGDSAFAGSTSSPLTQTVNQGATTTSLTSSRNPSQAGQAVIFTATVAVTEPGAGMPTGTVAFQDGGVDLSGCASQPLSGGQATCSISSLSVGSHSISAVYSGDDNFSGSTSNTVSQTVTTIGTSTTLASSANPAVVGEQVTYSATISPIPDGGTVAFQDGSATIGGCGSQPVDTGTGKATCQLTYRGTGSHQIVAVYSGDPTYDGSTSNTVTQTVNKAATTTTLSSSSNPSVATRPVTYTATVTVTSPGAGSPSGTVAFTDGGTTISGCPSQPLSSSGTATCTVTYATAGTHTITATYSGDSSFAGSTSATLTQTVNSDLKTTLSLTPNPVARGQLLTIKGSVTNVGTASESVTLSYRITAPNGSSYAHTIGTVTVGAGKTLAGSWTYRVPGNTPTGTYTVTFTAQDKTGSSSATQKETVT